VLDGLGVARGVVDAVGVASSSLAGSTVAVGGSAEGVGLASRVGSAVFAIGIVGIAVMGGGVAAAAAAVGIQSTVGVSC
jgi:hypothetical protein